MWRCSLSSRLWATINRLQDNIYEPWRRRVMSQAHREPLKLAGHLWGCKWVRASLHATRAHIAKNNAAEFRCASHVVIQNLHQSPRGAQLVCLAVHAIRKHDDCICTPCADLLVPRCKRILLRTCVIAFDARSSSFPLCTLYM
jgi:hypothetical protein